MGPDGMCTTAVAHILESIGSRLTGEQRKNGCVYSYPWRALIRAGSRQSVSLFRAKPPNAPSLPVSTHQLALQQVLLKCLPGRRLAARSNKHLEDRGIGEGSHIKDARSE